MAESGGTTFTRLLDGDPTVLADITPVLRHLPEAGGHPGTCPMDGIDCSGRNPNIAVSPQLFQAQGYAIAAEVGYHLLQHVLLLPMP